MFREFFNHRIDELKNIHVVDLKCGTRGPSSPIVIPIVDGHVAVTGFSR
jgi:hypothetical protein